MTIGIYSLYWENPDLVYIGQSDNIERRYKEHIIALSKNKHFNYKVQNAFNRFGEPQFSILEICNISRLVQAEIECINEFDAIVSGLNIAEPGPIVSSPRSRHAKYSEYRILKCFVLLYTTKHSLPLISQKLKINLSTVKAIAAGTKHSWLKDKYPDQYVRMLNRGVTEGLRGRKLESGYTYQLIDPIGTLYTTNSLKGFCESTKDLANNSKSAYSILQRVALGSSRNKSYKGWRVQRVF